MKKNSFKLNVLEEGRMIADEMQNIAGGLNIAFGSTMVISMNSMSSSAVSLSATGNGTCSGPGIFNDNVPCYWFTSCSAGSTYTNCPTADGPYAICTSGPTSSYSIKK
jgi:hypothetical protein